MFFCGYFADYFFYLLYFLVYEFLNSSLFHCFIMIYDILSQLHSDRCQQYIYIYIL